MLPPTQIAPSKPVDREKQVTSFRDILARVQKRRPTPTTLLEFSGGPGIGKSTLLTLLKRAGQEFQAPVVSINFKLSSPTSYFDDPAALIRDLFTALNAEVANTDKAQKYAEAFDRDWTAYHKSQPPAEAAVRAYFRLIQGPEPYFPSGWVEALRTVAYNLISLARSFDVPSEVTTTPVAFFFDETEYAPPELLDWLEEWVVNPLAQLKHCIIVWTSRRPWRWKRPEIRRRIKVETLKSFSPEAVRLQFKENSSNPSLAEQLFQNVYALTKGHPFASQTVINQLNDWQAAQTPLTPALFEDREVELRRLVFETVVEKYAFMAFGEDASLKQAARLLALVRQFDSAMVQAVLLTWAKEFESYSMEDFGDLLLRLKKSQLVLWDKGYTLDPDLRYLIREHYFANEEVIYLEVNLAAYAVYDQWLTKVIDNRSQYVIEALYHLACLQRLRQKPNLAEYLAKRLETVPLDLAEALARRLQEYKERFADPAARRSALERLEAEIEHDPGLKELEQLAPALEIGVLTQHVHDFSTALDAPPTTEEPVG